MFKNGDTLVLQDQAIREGGKFWTGSLERTWRLSHSGNESGLVGRFEGRFGSAKWEKAESNAHGEADFEARKGANSRPHFLATSIAHYTCK